MTKTHFYSAKLAGYSSVVGQPIMLLDEAGACVGQLSLIGFQGDYKAAVQQVADAMNAPERHAFRVGRVVGKYVREDELEAARNDALREAASIAANACLVPPDGGNPTKAEVDVCNEACDRILALIAGEQP